MANAIADETRGLRRKISVLFLDDLFDGPEGGTEQHLLFLQRELSREAFDLHFAVLGGVCGMRSGDFPIPPIMLGEGLPGGLRGAFWRVRRLAGVIRSVKADVVHAFCRRSEAYAILATKLARRGKVLGIRRNIGHWHNCRTRWLARMVGGFGAEYVANCEAARRFAAQVEWISPCRVCVIHNPAPRSRLTEGLAGVPSRASLGIVDGEKVVGMVAAVKPVKDYDVFLRSAKLILERHPRTRFLAIGPQDGDYMRRLQRLARELHIERQVSWVGPIPNPMSVMPLVDVGVLSSQSEAFSNVLLEYAAAGVATVATDVGGTREIIDDGRTGVIVPPRDSGALAEPVCRLLGDAPMRHELAANAQKKAQAAFSQEKVLDQYGRLYFRLSGRAVETNTPPERLA